MKISIITVCYNSAATIQDTISSVASQNFKDVEHIIVDGGSSDETMDIVRAASSITRYVSERDQGIYDAMNKGIALATGEVIGFLNSDDFYANDTVLSQVAAALEDIKVDACFADLLYVDKSDTNRVLRYWKSRVFTPGLFKNGWMPAHPTFYARRSVYQRFGKFNLNFKRQADFELTMRLMEVHQIATVYIPNIWIKMRIGGASNNSIKGIIKGNWEAYQACRINGLKVSPFFILRKILSRVPQFFHRPGVSG